MSTSLNTAQQRIVDLADAFADEFLEPIAADLDRTAKFPKGIIEELAKRDMLGLALPKAPGGFSAHVEVLHRLSQSCPAVATIVNNHAVVAYAIGKWGSDTQKTNYLSALAKGKTLAGICVYESGPALGLGAHPLRATAAGGTISLTGKKAFVRNAGVAEIFLVFATLPAEDDKTIVGAFIVEAKAPGLSIGIPAQTMGLHGCPVAEVIFENVRLNAAARLGTPADGPAILSETMSAYAIGEAAQTVGVGRAAAKHAAAAAKHRIQFGHPIFSLQAIQTLLAEIATDVHLAWHGVRHAAQLLDGGLPFETESAMIKSFLGRFGAKMLVDSIQVEGGLGISEIAPPHFNGTLPLARLFRDLAGTTLLEMPADFPESLVAASL